jgi:hypothetical protein
MRHPTRAAYAQARSSQNSSSPSTCASLDTPCLADLSQLSNSAALLRKISSTEWTSLGHQFGGRVHHDLQTPHLCGVTRQDLT